MDEALLPHEAAGMRVDDDEDDEMLWNALNDDNDAAERQPLAGIPRRIDVPYDAAPSAPGYRAPGPNAHAMPAATSAFALPNATAHLPSLRAHVHLPAISTMFERIAESAKSTLMGDGPRVPRDAANTAPATGESSVLRSSILRLRARADVPDEYGRVLQLDAFLINLYNYFYHKGFASIAIVELVSLFTGIFSVSLSSFLLGCVQWHELLTCHDHEDGCKQELEHYVTCSAQQPGVRHLVVAFYFAVFLVYWVFRALQLSGTLRSAYEMGAFYTQRLNIDARQLQTISWDEVVTRVLALVHADASPKHVKQISSYRLQIDPVLLSSPQDFARRIMRRENYLIAFMNHSLFQSSQLLPMPLQIASTSHVMFSRNMECNLNICLVDRMFDADFQLSPALINDEQMLQKRFVIAGVLNLVLIPFLLIYRLFHFLFTSALEWHMHQVHYFSTRRWSAYALWKLREYNELPHVLEARMARTYPQAERYLSMFPAGPLAVIAGGISFCIASLLGVLLAFGLLEDQLLLETTLYGRKLGWYLAFGAAAFAFTRTFVSETSPFLVNGDCEEAMLQLAAETHYFPPEWRGLCHTFDVRDAFLSLFPHKAELFVQECLSVILAPYVLCVALPRSSRELLLFIRSHSLAVPGVGAVCRYAEFDFKRYVDDGKMERSFLNFKQNHPTWVGADEGEQLVQRLGQIKEQELEKSLHMGDTMLGSQSLTLSQQLLQSQAIQTAIGGRILPLAQENEFYWLEKLHQRGHLGDSSLHEEEKDESSDMFASVRV